MAWLCAGGLLLCALPAHAAEYYVTVAGLGGEPDYEQRFTAMAADLDKSSKAPAARCTSTRSPAIKPRANT